MIKIYSFDIGEKNFGVTHANIIDNNKLLINFVDNINLLNKNKQTVILSCINLTNFLNNCNLEDCLFVIEQQLNTNIRCKILFQHLWTTLYERYGDKNIYIIPPNRKNTIFKLGKLSYKKNKQFNIDFVLNNKDDIIINYEKIIRKINEYDKKDDICDSIMLIIVFIKERYNKINEP